MLGGIEDHSDTADAAFAATAYEDEEDKDEESDSYFSRRSSQQLLFYDYFDSLTLRECFSLKMLGLPGVCRNISGAIEVLRM